MATPIPMNKSVLEAGMIGGRVVRSSGKKAIGISTDSRAIAAGNAFVAIRGATMDGHAHQKAAVDAGAVLLVAEHGRALDDARADAVEVDDTLVTWGEIARAHLRSWRSRTNGKVVAITGSAGKTTTKELCAALLGEVAPVWATPGNLNNLVGLPAAALCVEDRHRFVVLEAGMSVPGEIERLGAICEPDVAIVTNIGMAHAGGVGGTLEGVANEKGALFAAAAQTCVAPIADAAAMDQLRRTRAKDIRTFGLSGKADYRIEERTIGDVGSKIRVGTPHGSIRLDLPLAGEAAAIDFVAALAAAEAIARPMTEVEIARGMTKLALPAGRAAVVRTPTLTIIDDTYNANPASMRAAFSMLAEIGKGKRTIAVLGEMRELGDAGESEHAALGDVIEANIVIGCGGMIARLLDRANARGIETHAAPDAKSAAALALGLVRPGDVVLVKGSRGVATEVVVEALRAR
jgi:UDP-N-acetylmuramoyl-tripeptide--D-alanyl-D-alanine ligase